MGKVTISTVLGYKEYVAENIKSILGEDEEKSFSDAGTGAA